jgi:Membrane proteins related to metalloendopeptidases
VAGLGHRFGQEMNQGEPFHSGVDLQALEGADTISPEDGIVEDVRNDPQGLGLTVIVRDKNGMQHKLGHLKDTRAYRGMVVAKGQNLAHVGSSGNTTGSHLHWAVKDQSGQPQDPTPALGAMGSLPPVPAPR